MNGNQKNSDNQGKKQTYKIQIDRDIHEVEDGRITGTEILGLAGRKPPSQWEVYMIVKGRPEFVANDESVDLTKPGLERFYTQGKTITEGSHEG